MWPFRKQSEKPQQSPCVCDKNMHVIGPRTRSEEKHGVKSQNSGVTVLEAERAVADGLRCFVCGAGTENAYGSYI